MENEFKAFCDSIGITNKDGAIFRAAKKAYFHQQQKIDVLNNKISKFNDALEQLK